MTNTQRVAVVTGGNGGLGLEAVTALAAEGAHVVMAARDQRKAETARQQVLRAHPGASVEVVELDLGSLDSVERAAGMILAAHPRIDILINNAGLMALPQGRTADGFETQLGVNVLGHWALTARLLPAIVRTPHARVVTLTSTAQHMGRPLDPRDPGMERRFDTWRAYGNSKLADRHLAQGLDRQFRAAGLTARAVTAQPGLTKSDLHTTSRDGGGSGGLGVFLRFLTARLGMSVERGGLIAIRAATDPDVPAETMYAPRWVANGAPVRRRLVRPGADRAIRILWEISRRLTGLDIDVARTLARATA
jgi:NAD(P)-dependent dehydrogenase (short-subunit alcohol dehydrogenase family)